MNIKKSLLPIAVVLGGAWLWFKSKRLANVAQSITTQFKAIRLNGFEIEITLGLFNPTNQKVKFSSLSGGLFVNRSKVATVKSMSPVLISGGTSTDLHVTLIPSGLGIFQTIKEIASGEGHGEIMFKGVALIDGFQLFIDQKLN